MHIIGLPETLVSPPPIAMLSESPSVASAAAPPDSVSFSSPVVVVLVSRAEPRPSAAVHIVPIVPLVCSSLVEGAVDTLAE
jgi:hypothetical protein